MNLSGRIKKLERTTNTSDYCQCLGQIKYEAAFNLDAPGMVEKAPDICEKCRKPVDKRFIEVTFEQYLENVRQRREQVQRTIEMYQD